MTDKRAILVVDDERSMRDFLEASLAPHYRVFTARGGREALSVLRDERIDVVLAEVRMSGAGGKELLAGVRELPQPHPPVVMMTAFGTIEQAVEATRHGAVDYLTKPFGLEQLEHVLGRAREFDVLRRENCSLRENLAARAENMGLIGAHPAMRRLREKILMIADSRGTVLLQGESGTGKEVVARAIHASGKSNGGPFIRINCAAIPEAVLESELFGHDRGVFTRAATARPGSSELAGGGTLLLDEISEMPSATQAKLLRLLPEWGSLHLGARPATGSDVRIIATTNRDLQQEIRKGDFREDLYFRLNVVPLYIVPLRRRKEDIPALAAHFCKCSCAENDKPLMRISERSLAGLMELDWPGNVRQLRNVIERAVILGSGHELADEILGLPGDSPATGRSVDFGDDMTLKDMERELILRKLEHTRGNRTQAARELGISVRTLRNKLNIYSGQGLEIPG